MTKYDIPEDHPRYLDQDRPIYLGDRVVDIITGKAGKVLGLGRRSTTLTLTVECDDGTVGNIGRVYVRWEEPKPPVTAGKVTLSGHVHERIMNGQATDADLIALQAAWIEAMAPAAEPDPMYATGNGWGRD